MTDKLQSDDMPDRLRQAMEDAGLTVTGLARQAKVSRPFIYALLDGKANPTLQKIEALAASLGVSPSWLAFGAMSFGTPEK